MRFIDKILLDSLPFELEELSDTIQKRCDEFKNILLTK